MFNTIKTQVTAYKWIIILSFIGILAVLAGVNYHRATLLAGETAELKEKNIVLETTIVRNQKQFLDFQESSNKALADLGDLREKLAEISGTTAQLQNRVNSLKTPPAPGGANYQQLEKDANSVTRDLFKRMEDASKGKTQ